MGVGVGVGVGVQAVKIVRHSFTVPQDRPISASIILKSHQIVCPHTEIASNILLS